MTEETPIADSKEISWSPPARIAGLSPRKFRLILAALTISLLCLAYYFLVMSPLHKPHLRMIGLTSTGETFNSSWSVRGENSDLYVDQALQELVDFSRELSLIRDEVGSSESQLLHFENQTDWSNLPTSLLEHSSAESDILVLFVSAQGIVRNGRAELHWFYNPDETGEPYVAVEDFLKRVKQHPAQTKLILLDAGWTTWSPQSGILINDFPRELENLVQAIDDPSLWVFCSHSVGRESTFHHPHRRSLFMEALLYGMRGPADIDGNHLIDLRELMHFTTSVVNEFSLQNAGLESAQHPFLSWGGGTVRIRQNWPVLIPVPTEEELKNAPQHESGGPETAVTHHAAWLPKLLASSWRVRPAVPSVNSSYAGPLAFLWWQAPAATANSSADAPENAAPAGPADSEATPSANRPTDEPKSDKPEKELSLGDEVLAVWSKRDALLELNEGCCSPMEFAPLELVRLERELIRMEFLARSVSEIKRPMFRRQLERIKAELDALSQQAHAGRKPSHALTLIQREELASRVHSVAMRTQLGTGNGPETQRLTQLSAQLFSAADAGDWSSFQSVAGSLSDADRKLEELGWADRLTMLDQKISSSLKLRSYQVCAASTGLVASAWQAFPWIQDELQSADRMRLSAERILVDGLISGTEVEVRNMLDRAVSEYLRLQKKVSKLNRAASLLELATTRLPAYAEWARLVSLESRGPAPRLEELLRLAKLCRQLRGYLQTRKAGEFPQLAKVADELERLETSLSGRTRLDALSEFISKPHLPGEPKQWESLLQTPLLHAGERAMLWSLIDERKFDYASVAIPSLKTELGLKPRPFTTAEQGELWTHLELQFKFLEIPGGSEAEKIESERNPDTGQINPSPLAGTASRVPSPGLLDSQKSWFLSIRSQSENLHRLWSSTASDLRTELPDRPTQLTSEHTAANLLEWELKARMLSPALYGRRPPVDPTRLRLSASLRDFLNWNADRLQQFSPELPSEMASRRQSWEGGYRSALVRFWPQSEVDIPELRTLSLTGESELDFRISGETTWTAECRNLTDEEQKIWFVLDYDREQLELTQSNHRVISLEELRRNRSLDRLVDRLQLQSESFVLRKPAPENKISAETIELKFKIRSISGKPSAVVLHAVSEEGNASLRMIPRLPFSDLWNVESVTGTQTFERRDENSILLPYPNRTTPYQFRLQYRGHRDRTLDVELFDLRCPLCSPSTVRFDDNPTLLATVSQLTVSHASPTLELKFPMAGILESGIRVRGPLAFRVSDLETSEIHWIPLFVETQRPRRYLNPIASYDAREGKLNLHLNAIDINTLPEGPIPVVCEIETLSDPASAVPFEPVKLEGELSREESRLQLLAAIPPKEGRVVSLKVHVDGFPRAFLFEVPCDASRDQIRELAGRTFSSILQPKPDQPFPADVSQLDVKLQVDAPVGAFPDLNRQNHVALGLDLNADTLRSPGESWMMLPSDRQADLFLSGSEEGVLQLRTAVNDWSVRLPTSGVRNRRVSIQPRLELHNAQVPGQPVSVLIDGLSPQIFPADIPPVVIGEPLEIFLEVDDQNLSGVASVEGYLDRTRTGRFPEPAPPKSDEKEEDQPPADQPVAGSLLENGSWLVQIPSGSVRAGRHQILVRATDRAGNTSRVVKLSARLMTQEEAAGPQGQRDVWGIVQFGDKPIAEAEVTLVSSAPPNPNPSPMEAAQTSFEAKSDEQGRFVFENVPFGEWTLTVKAMIAGRLRIDQRTLNIAAPPTASRIQRVKLR